MAKKRRCRTCKDYKTVSAGIITPSNAFFCCPEHATQYAINAGVKRREKMKIDKLKKERKERQEKKRDRSWKLAKAQELVNRYINLRDYGKPCFSCGKPFGTHRRNASHYRSVGACSALRFNTWNIHSACVQCNKDYSGNAIEYRIMLVKVYGSDRVEWLESQNGTFKRTTEYLDRLIYVFRRLVKREKKRIQSIII